MFTGLIEAVGTVTSLAVVPSGLRLRAEAALANELRPGDSLAVNGVCLTVVTIEGRAASFDVGPETARVTALGTLRPGAPVNLERAVRADTRMGGHFVQGHVDATGTLAGRETDADFTWMTFTFPPAHAAWLIPKGAVAVEGVSLTVATLGDDRFSVQIVPFTSAHTNLAALRIGDRVNLEFDMLGKYAVRAAQFAARPHAPSPVPSLP